MIALGSNSIVGPLMESIELLVPLRNIPFKSSNKHDAIMEFIKVLIECDKLSIEISGSNTLLSARRTMGGYIGWISDSRRQVIYAFE